LKLQGALPQGKTNTLNKFGGVVHTCVIKKCFWSDLWYDQKTNNFTTQLYLVGRFNHLEKYEFVNGKDENP
jgi:endoglucanase Acf2